MALTYENISFTNFAGGINKTGGSKLDRNELANALNVMIGDKGEARVRPRLIQNTPLVRPTVSQSTRPYFMRVGKFYSSQDTSILTVNFDGKIQVQPYGDSDFEVVNLLLPEDSTAMSSVGNWVAESGCTVTWDAASSSLKVELTASSGSFHMAAAGRRRARPLFPDAYGGSWGPLIFAYKGSRSSGSTNNIWKANVETYNATNTSQDFESIGWTGSHGSTYPSFGSTYTQVTTWVEGTAPTFAFDTLGISINDRFLGPRLTFTGGTSGHIYYFKDPILCLRAGSNVAFKGSATIETFSDAQLDPESGVAGTEFGAQTFLRHHIGGEWFGDAFYLTSNGRATNKSFKLAADTWSEITDHTLDGSGTEFPLAKHLINKHSRMFAANIFEGATQYPSRLWFSEEGDAETWGALSWIDVEPADGTSITGLASFGEGIMIFKEDKLFFLSGVDEDSFTLFPLQEGVGTVSTNTIVNLENTVVWLDPTKGVLEWDGSKVKNLSRKIWPIETLLEGSEWRIEDMHAVVMVQWENHLLLSWPSTPSTTQAATTYPPDRYYCWAMNLDTKAWTRWDVGFTAAARNSAGTFVAGIETSHGNYLSNTVCSFRDDPDITVDHGRLTTNAWYIKTGPQAAQNGKRFKVRQIDIAHTGQLNASVGLGYDGRTSHFDKWFASDYAYYDGVRRWDNQLDVDARVSSFVVSPSSMGSNLFGANKAARISGQNTWEIHPDDAAKASFGFVSTGSPVSLDGKSFGFWRATGSAGTNHNVILLPQDYTGVEPGDICPSDAAPGWYSLDLVARTSKVTNTSIFLYLYLLYPDGSTFDYFSLGMSVNASEGWKTIRGPKLGFTDSWNQPNASQLYWDTYRSVWPYYYRLEAWLSIGSFDSGENIDFAFINPQVHSFYPASTQNTAAVGVTIAGKPIYKSDNSVRHGSTFNPQPTVDQINLQVTSRGGAKDIGRARGWRQDN